MQPPKRYSYCLTSECYQIKTGLQEKARWEIPFKWLELGKLCSVKSGGISKIGSFFCANLSSRYCLSKSLSGDFSTSFSSFFPSVSIFFKYVGDRPSKLPELDENDVLRNLPREQQPLLKLHEEKLGGQVTSTPLSSPHFSSLAP